MTRHRRFRKTYLHVQWSNISSQERVAASVCLSCESSQPSISRTTRQVVLRSLSRPCALKFPAPGPVLVARGSRGPTSEEEPLLACGKAPSLSKPPLNKVLGFGYPTRVITVLLISVDLCHLSTGPRLVIHSPLLCVINWEAWAGFLKWCTVRGKWQPGRDPLFNACITVPTVYLRPPLPQSELTECSVRDTQLPVIQVTSWVA